MLRHITSDIAFMFLKYQIDKVHLHLYDNSYEDKTQQIAVHFVANKRDEGVLA